MPEAFLDIIDRADLKNIELGDQVARPMTVLVTDIRSFSTLSERMTFEFGAYEEATQAFREVARLDPDDRAARAMMAKARKLADGDTATE